MWRGHFHTWSFFIFFPGLQATSLCRVNESPRRSSTSMDRTGRPITPCASHQLFWHTAWWDRTHLAAAMGPLWWRRSHILSCANCSNLLVLWVFIVLLLPSLVTDIQMRKLKDINVVVERLFNLSVMSCLPRVSTCRGIKLTSETTSITSMWVCEHSRIRCTRAERGEKRGRNETLWVVEGFWGRSDVNKRRGGQNEGWFRKEKRWWLEGRGGSDFVITW